MALTQLQRRICQLVAAGRDGARSYVAGGIALNAVTSASRVSFDIDLFHDSQEAVKESARRDRAALVEAGLSITEVRDVPGFVEVEARDAVDAVLVQWAADSAFRFFPLERHPDLGWTMHPLDLATNKVCALVGRVEVRDWLDTLTCHERIQPLGLLAWAATGKDAGLNPRFILGEAARTARYSRAELATLAFEGEAPDIEERFRVWRAALQEGEQLVAAMPTSELGTCVLNLDGTPYRGTPTALTEAIQKDRVLFHQGAIRGAIPKTRALG